MGRFDRGLAACLGAAILVAGCSEVRTDPRALRSQAVANAPGDIGPRPPANSETTANESQPLPDDPSNAVDPAAAGADVDLGSDTPATAAAARSITMSFTGDTLPHSPLWRGAIENAGGAGFDFFPMFASIAPLISQADLATCHLETPIAPVGEDFSTDPLYGVPPEIVGAMAQAGYDRCSTASNHALDRGAAGIDRTVGVLLEHGMTQAGMARAEAEYLPAPIEVEGIAIGHLSYTYGTNGIPIPSSEPWRTNLIDPARIIRDAGAIRAAGAEVVVVSLHWGTEGRTEPDALQLQVADEITASGAIDLVIGHHAHVLQPIAQVNGVWVAYGLGNILSNLPVNDWWPAATQDAAIVEFDVGVAAGTTTVSRPRVIPTWVDKDHGWVVRDVAAELARTDLDDARRAELQRSFDRTTAVLGDFVVR